MPAFKLLPGLATMLSTGIAAVLLSAVPGPAHADSACDLNRIRVGFRELLPSPSHPAANGSSTGGSTVLSPAPAPS